MGSKATIRQRMMRRLGSLASTNEELRAEELRETTDQQGCERIAGCTDREMVHVLGEVRTVTLQPRAGNPALEAELFDGSGSLTLVFLGRRRIAGIEPGRALEAVGRVCGNDGRRVMFNPRYQLRPTDTTVTAPPATRAG